MANGLKRKFKIWQRRKIQMAATLFEDKGNCWNAVASALLCAAILVHAPTAVWPQSVKTQQDAERVLAIEKLTIKDGVVAGEVSNRSARLLRGVELFIRYTWLWDDEMKPGKVDPGTSSYYTLQKEIAPGGRLAFTFQPSTPLTQMGGGRYQTSVTIAGFTEVMP
jgi:hypothetical protein